MNIVRQDKERPVPLSFGPWPTSSPASATPRERLRGLTSATGQKEGYGCRRRLTVSFVPEGLSNFAWKDGIPRLRWPRE
jgi:hypothetical protein